MSGATYAKFQTWAEDEDVTTADLNNQFDTERANLMPQGVDDYSATQAQMRVTTNPGPVGSESLATSTAGEIERLRYQLKAITGGTQWYEAPSTSLAQLRYATEPNSSGSDEPHRIWPRSLAKYPGVCFSSRTGQPLPSHSTEPILRFVAVINNVTYTISTTLTLNGLSLAPSSNNTALVTTPATRLSGSRDKSARNRLTSISTPRARNHRTRRQVGRV